MEAWELEGLERRLERIEDLLIRLLELLDRRLPQSTYPQPTGGTITVRS